MAYQHYTPRQPYTFQREEQQIAAAEASKEAEKEANEPVKQITKMAIAGAPAMMNVLGAVNKLETAKLTESGLTEVSFGGVDMFQSSDLNFKGFAAGIKTSGATYDPGFITTEISNQTRDWTSRIEVNQDIYETINPLTEKNFTVAEVEKIIADKGFDSDILVK